MIQKEKFISIVITGDFCPIGRTIHICNERKYKGLYNDVLPFLMEKDLSITDLECPLINKPSPIDKTGPNLIAPENCINALKFAKFDVTALANNHILDQDEKGLINTIRLCHENGIQTVGAGINLEEARKPLFIDVKGITLGIINICENEFSIAGKNKAGANPLDIINNYNVIKQAKYHCDYLLLIFHGGIEHHKYPTPNMVKNFRFFIDIGVDAIVSAHAHIASGYEIYKEKPIFYGLGNFIFDYQSKHKNWNEGFLLKLKIYHNNLQTDFEILPFEQFKEAKGLSLMLDHKKNTFLNELKEISKTIINEEMFFDMWGKFINEMSINQIVSFLPFIPFKRQFIKSKRNSKKIKKILLGLNNTIRCDSLREICLESFRLHFNKETK